MYVTNDNFKWNVWYIKWWIIMKIILDVVNDD